MDQFLFGIFQIDKINFKILVQNLYYTLNVKPRCQIFTTIHLRHLCTHKIQNNSKGTAKNIFGRKKFGGRIAPNLVAVLPPIWWPYCPQFWPKGPENISFVQGQFVQLVIMILVLLYNLSFANQTIQNFFIILRIFFSNWPGNLYR